MAFHLLVSDNTRAASSPSGIDAGLESFSDLQDGHFACIRHLDFLRSARQPDRVSTVSCVLLDLDPECPATKIGQNAQAPDASVTCRQRFLRGTFFLTLEYRSNSSANGFSNALSVCFIHRLFRSDIRLCRFQKKAIVFQDITVCATRACPSTQPLNSASPGKFFTVAHIIRQHAGC